MDGNYEFGKPYQTWLLLGIHVKIQVSGVDMLCCNK